MAKKRKATSSTAVDEHTGGWNDQGGKVAAISSYQDVADSEDEFHINRDKILLNEGPDAKKRRKHHEEDVAAQLSDDEILGYSSESEEEDNHAAGAHPHERSAEDGMSLDQEEAEEEEEGWGASRKDYYDADEIQTEAQALEEEVEAKRLQQKRLQKMSEADFGFDENEWMNASGEDDDGDVVTEVLKDVEITSEMGPEERLRILQTRYPEFDFLANEFLNLQPRLTEFQEQAMVEKMGSKSVVLVKFRALAAYIAALTMYFAILTSPAKDTPPNGRTLDPSELREHAVMESLLQCKELWSKAKLLRAPSPSPEEHVFDRESIAESDRPPISRDIEITKRTPVNAKTKKERAREIAVAEKTALRFQQMQDVEIDLQDLSNLAPKSRKSKRVTKAIEYTTDDSDFGEEGSLDAKSAAEKEKKKKSLRFYTSQIAQKSNRRAGAGRDAGGDTDIPVKERLRDKQARLNAEAETRGKKLDEYGRGATALDGDSGTEEENVADQVRGEEDAYYDLVAKTSKSKRDTKDAKMEVVKQAKAEGAMVRVTEGEMDENGKRAIGYVIEKNKGLAPKRKKDVRNPRVKKRKKFEEKKKKLASQRAVYKGGEEKGGYGGEKTGIKPGLVKSIKL